MVRSPSMRPDRLDQLLAAGFQAGRGGQVGQDLEGAPQPAVRARAPRRPASRRRATGLPSRPRRVDRPALRAAGGAQRGGEPPAWRTAAGAGARARRKAARSARQAVAAPALDPQTATRSTTRQAPRPASWAPGRSRDRRSSSARSSSAKRVHHLVTQEEAHRRDLQQPLRIDAVQPHAAGRLDGETQRPVPAVARHPQRAGGFGRGDCHRSAGTRAWRPRPGCSSSSCGASSETPIGASLHRRSPAKTRRWRG